ncbi:DUF222 domain-containing protein [Microbacterium sp. NPDC057407]|uniref:HNH endonuclease signature motif containing protein n=1 Tax=Microbacterium sp. NPDC057407 TaxID=3346120 RepID=UPI00366B5EF8
MENDPLDDLGAEYADHTDDLEGRLAESDWLAPPLDEIDRVTEVAGMMAVFAAERFAHVDALRLQALAEVGRYGGAIAPVVERSVRLELAAALRVTESAAGQLMAVAESLVHRYPAALTSLSRARMTERHAEVLATMLNEVDEVVRDELVPRAVELAETLAVGAFRRSLRRLIDLATAASLAERQRAALGKRRVIVEPAADGMAWVHAFLPAVEAFALHSRITAIGKTLTAHPDEERTLDQARADVFGDLLIDGDTAALPQSRGIRATVAVTVPALALLHPDDRSRHAAGLAPAVVEGVGPIPLERAGELCGGAEGWMRVLTHPETGMVLSVGRDQYRPPPALRRLVRWRSETCMAPGCGIPASGREIDHTQAWEHGGETTVTNLAPLCKGHHTVKHHGGWSVRQPTDGGGAVEWRSPSGRRYLVQPTRPTPAFRPSPTAPYAGDAPF